jgi:hypothetical protein
MNTPHPVETQMSLEQAHQLLRQFDCNRAATIDTSFEQLRQAVLTVAHHSDYQILGICADDLTSGLAALQEYATALEYPVPAPNVPAEGLVGSIYLKFNPKTAQVYADGYTGQYRGVLVSCQSAYSDGLNEMYGHLPLELFAQSDQG